MQLRSIGYINPPDTLLLSPISNTALETIILGSTIPAAFLPTFGSIVFRATIAISTASVAPTLTVNLKLGTQTLTILNAQTISSSLVNKILVIEAAITHSTLTNTQIAYGEIRQPETPILGLFTSQVKVASASGWTIDPTVDQPATLSVKFGTANASNIAQLVRGIMTFG